MFYIEWKGFKSFNFKRHQEKNAIGAVHKRRRNFLGLFWYPPPPCRNFDPDLPNFLQHRYFRLLSQKTFQRLLWMAPMAKSPNHHCNWWKDPALSLQPLKSSESSRSRVKQAMEKPQPCALSNCPFLFLVGEFQKLASRNRKCIESVLRTHTYMRARARALNQAGPHSRPDP